MIIVFDLDGTLIDSAPDICAAGNTVLAAEGAPPMSLAEATGFIGGGAPLLIERMIAARGLEPERHDAMLSRFLELYDDAVHLTQLFPGVEACLEKLAWDGHALGICTNKPESPARAVLDHFGLLPRFGTILGGDTLKVKKPDPVPLITCIAALGGGRALYVGDSEVDAETAERAGVPFALFTRGYRNTPVDALPHAQAFDDFADLPGVIATYRGVPS